MSEFWFLFVVFTKLWFDWFLGLIVDFFTISWYYEYLPQLYICMCLLGTCAGVCVIWRVCVCACVRGPKSRLQDMTVKPLSGFRPNCKQAKKKNWALRQRQERKFKLLNRSRRKATGGLSSLIFPCFLYVATIFPQGYGVWGGRGGVVWCDRTLWLISIGCTFHLTLQLISLVYFCPAEKFANKQKMHHPWEWVAFEGVVRACVEWVVSCLRLFVDNEFR